MSGNMIFSRDSALEHNEPQIGTAATQTAWLLLEYRPVWSFNAVARAGNSLSATVADYLYATLAEADHCRMLFIRQSGRTSGPLKMYIAFTDETNPALYGFDLKEYDDIVGMPLVEMLNGAIDERYQVDEPLYAVCVNKERDRCCGTHGWSVYQELSKLNGDRVWQATHIGSHRFAGTMIAFLHGTYYGYLDPHDAQSVYDAEEAQTIYLPKLRGRSCYDGPTQVADAFIRNELSLTHYDGLVLVTSETIAPDEHIVTFSDGSTEYPIHVTVSKSDYEVFRSTVRVMTNPNGETIYWNDAKNIPEEPKAAILYACKRL